MQNPDANNTVKYCEYVDEVECRMWQVFEIVREHLGRQADRIKRYYNVGVKPKTFAVNDLVLYYYPRKYTGRSPKWSRVYSGICRLKKNINDAVYIIRKIPNSSTLVVNVDKLKLYYGEVPSCWKKGHQTGVGKWACRHVADSETCCRSVGGRDRRCNCT